jgi:hypothetical protein
MNPFLLSSSDRLTAWRDLRNTLSEISELDQLTQLAHWAGLCPLVKYSLDPETPSSWPTPWDVLHENKLCSTALAYIAEQTLIMIGWNPDRLRLVYLKNITEQEMRMILLVDDTWAINYSQSELFNFDIIRSESALLAVYKAVEGGHVDA